MPGMPLPSTTYRYRRVAGTQPGANAEVADTVPAGKYWWLISATIAMVQGATQTPQPALVIDDGSNNIVSTMGASGAMTASTTATFTWGVGLSLTALVGATPNIIATGGLPDFLLLPPGFRIKTLTAGLGANSQWGVPSYFVCEFTT